MGGGDLPLGVADHGRGGDARGFPEARQGDHQRKEGGLDYVEALQPGALRVSQHVLCQRPLDEWRERLLAGVDLLFEEARALVELQAHPDPLGALTGEEEDGVLVCGG